MPSICSSRRRPLAGAHPVRLSVCPSCLRSISITCRRVSLAIGTFLLGAARYLA